MNARSLYSSRFSLLYFGHFHKLDKIILSLHRCNKITPLMIACRALSVETVKVIVEGGGDMLACDLDGANCLDYAVSPFVGDETLKGGHQSTSSPSPLSSQHVLSLRRGAFSNARSDQISAQGR